MNTQSTSSSEANEENAAIERYILKFNIWRQSLLEISSNLSKSFDDKDVEKELFEAEEKNRNEVDEAWETLMLIRQEIIAGLRR
jgi:hypothetical protein